MAGRLDSGVAVVVAAEAAATAFAAELEAGIEGSAVEVLAG